MILNIRGTSGSGKSTIVRKLMAKFEYAPIMSGGKIEAYRLPTPHGPLYVIGRYETPCGGCDGISTQDEVCRRVTKYAKKGHVIFEGLIVTSCYKRYLDLFRKLKQPYRFLFLNTKLETCLKSVEKRRESRGAKTPFNPTNTISKYESTLRSIERAKEDGADYKVVSRSKAVEEILCLLQKHPFQTMKK